MSAAGSCCVTLITIFVILFAILNAVKDTNRLTEMPTYFETMTPVFLVTKNGIDTPATMIYRGTEPIFFHLYTNQTIGNYHDYTGIASRLDAYKNIYTSYPTYPGHSLHQILARTGQPIILKHPAMQEMFKRREPVMWTRCVRHHETFMEWLLQQVR
jgi:hypothetical protein